MAIPLRVSALKQSERWPSKIIIHSTSCILPNYNLTKLDSQKFQASLFQNKVWQLEKKDSGVHFIIDRVDNDFQVIVGQPLMTNCVYEDIPELYHSDIHIAVMGDYNNDIPMKRIYKVLSYKLLNPLMRLFALDESDIIFHSSISENNKRCPGDFFDMSDLLTVFRSLRRKKALSRSKTH